MKTEYPVTKLLEESVEMLTVLNNGETVRKIVSHVRRLEEMYEADEVVEIGSPNPTLREYAQVAYDLICVLAATP